MPNFQSVPGTVNTLTAQKGGYPTTPSYTPEQLALGRSAIAGQQVAPGGRLLTQAVSTPPPAPSAPIVKQVHTDPTGASVTTHYSQPTPQPSTGTTQSTPDTAQPATQPLKGLVTLPTGNVVNTETGETYVKQGAQSTSGAFPSAVSGIMGLAGAQSPLIQAQQEETQKIAGLRSQLAQRIGAVAATPGDYGFQTGLTAALQQTEAAQETAASQQLQALTGIQQQQVGTYQAAAGLAKPELAGYGQTYYSPMGDQQIGAGQGGAFNDAMSTYVQMATQGNYAAIPDTIKGNPVLNAEVIQGAQKLDPNFDPISAGAKSSSISELTGHASSIQAQANGAEANFNLMSNIARQGGVNDMNVPILNTLQQNLQRGLTSSAAVTNFQSLIQSVRSQYASILGGGTVTVEALQEAQQLIPQDISLTALESLGNQLKSDAQNRVTGINQQINTMKGKSAPVSGATGGWSSLGD